METRIGKVYKLIQVYPGSPKLGTMVCATPTRNDNEPIYYQTVSRDAEDGKLYVQMTSESFPAYGCKIVEDFPDQWVDISDEYALGLNNQVYNRPSLETYLLRLQRLVNFLNAGKFNGFKAFNFESYTCALSKDINGHWCGTSACAMGLSPLVFPSRIKYHDSEEAVFDGIVRGWRYIGEELFGLPYGIYDLLFIPASAGFNPVRISDHKIQAVSKNATAKEVAANIQLYIDLCKEKGGMVNIYGDIVKQG